MAEIKLVQDWAVTSLRNDVRDSLMWTGEQSILLQLYHAGDSDVIPCPECFAPGALIRTETGYRPIEEICVGDRVLTADGTYQRVLETMNRHHSGVAYQWRTGMMTRSVISTGNHPVWALKADHKHNNKMFMLDGIPFCGPSVCEPYIPTRQNMRGKSHEVGWVEVKDLGKKSWIATRVPIEEVDIDFVDVPAHICVNHQPSRERKGPRRFELTEDFLWMIGLYIAEGSTGDRDISFGLHENEIEYRDRLLRIFTDYGYTCRVVKPNNHGISVCVSSSILSEWFSMWIGKGCNNKQIPQEFMALPSKKCLQLVKGIWHGDGYNNFRRIKQTSEILSLQIAEIFRRHGIQSTIHMELDPPDTINGNKRKPAYINVWPANNNRKQLRGWWFFKGQEQLIQMKEHNIINYDGMVYNLNVEGTHTYVVNNTLVHNCGDDIYSSPEVQCQSCYGTNFDGAVRLAMLVWALYTDHPSSEQLSNRGQYRPDIREVQTEAFPLVGEHDVIVRVQQWTSVGVPSVLEGYYELQTVTQRSLRTGARFGQSSLDVVAQKATLSELSSNMGITNYPIIGQTFTESVQIVPQSTTLPAQAIVEPDTRVIYFPFEAAPGGVVPDVEGTDVEGTGADDVAFVFTQVIAQTTWTITHNLGYNPSVSIMVDGEEVDADVDYPNTTVAVVTFGTPQAGTARLT